jgi:hypothetical protein
VHRRAVRWALRTSEVLALVGALFNQLSIFSSALFWVPAFAAGMLSVYLRLVVEPESIKRGKADRTNFFAGTLAR